MSPISLANIPLLPSLYKSGILTASAKPKRAASAALNAKIGLIRNDITKLEIDCIVNAANESLMGGGGVDGVIHRAAGRSLKEECSKLGGCPTGDAKATGAYNLPCRKVIHTVGPIYHSDSRVEAEGLLRSCYRRSLTVAVEEDMKSIAFSAISTGVYDYPSEDAAEVVIDEVRQFLDAGSGDALENVIFCNFTDKDMDAYKEFLPQFFPPATEDLSNGTLGEGAES